MADILMYGSLDCEDTEASRKLLDRLTVPYRFIDVDADEAAGAEAASLNGGHLKTPTILFEPGEPPLIEPDDEQLLGELARWKLVAVD